MLFNNINKIIKNNKLLSIDYIPEKIIGRDEEIKELGFQFSYTFRETISLPQLFIFGCTGSGKTTILLYVLNELKKEIIKKGLKIKIVKIKGSECKTKYELLRRILSQISPQIKISKSSSDLHEKIIEVISEGMSLLLLFDEIHDVKDNEINNVLYTISRLGQDVSFSDKKTKTLEKHEKGHVGYVLISNDANIRNKLKENTKSSLTRESLIFKRYSVNEIIKILESRIKEGALYENKIDDGVLEYISAISIKEGRDARYGLNLLFNSAKETEKNKEDKINLKTVKQINEVLVEDYLMQLLRDYPPLYIKILKIIHKLHKNEEIINSRSIWVEYEKTTDDFEQVNYSRISQIITSLEKDNIVYVTHSKKTKLRNLSIEENLRQIEKILNEREVN